jgi:para-nitrobenzyl esterase
MRAALNTRAGRLEGNDRGGILAFKGVPYASAPKGSLRFRPPQPAKPWRGARSAQNFGSAAPQLSPASALVGRLMGSARGAQNEDCLCLNVWTSGTDDRRRPVMVFIHGGAFVLGSGGMSLYSGSRLARRGDVVVVTINYRLGALGFLDLSEIPGMEECGNLGIRDQIAALEWVRDNIADFGGDPENVTIFGESAGGMSVGTLLGTPAARGLFHRAILQSGAADNVSSPEQARRVTEAFFEELGRDPETVAGKRDLSLTQILGAQSRTTRKMGMALGILPWQPSVDGQLIPRQPLDALTELAADLPILVGTNREEFKLFMIADRGAQGMDDDALRERLSLVLPGKNDEGQSRSQLAMEHYARLRSSRGAPLTPASRWGCFQTDRIFREPAFRLADAHAENSRAGTWSYRFDWRPPILGARLGACHALELPFVFGTLRAPGVRQVLGSTRAARELSRVMQQAWVAFAHTGDPHHADLPEWPRYAREHGATMLFGTERGIGSGPSEEERRFWESAFQNV